MKKLSIDQLLLPEFLTSTNYPSPIFRSFLLAINGAADSSLTVEARKLLAVIIAAGFNIKNRFKAVYATKQFLFESAGISERSGYRCLSALEHAGLIKRLRQRCINGTWQVGSIVLTEKAIEKLFPEPNLKVPRVEAPSPIDQNIHLPNSKSEADKTGLTTKGQLQQSAICQVRYSEVTIPSDLRWLEDLGLRKTGIAKLMGMARKFGKQLSELLSTYKDVIKSNARDGFSYVKKLLERDQWSEYRAPVSNPVGPKFGTTKSSTQVYANELKRDLRPANFPNSFERNLIKLCKENPGKALVNTMTQEYLHISESTIAWLDGDTGSLSLGSIKRTAPSFMIRHWEKSFTQSIGDYALVTLSASNQREVKVNSEAALEARSRLMELTSRLRISRY